MVVREAESSSASTGEPDERLCIGGRRSRDSSSAHGLSLGKGERPHREGERVEVGGREECGSGMGEVSEGEVSGERAKDLALGGSAELLGTTLPASCALDEKLQSLSCEIFNSSFRLR